MGGFSAQCPPQPGVCREIESRKTVVEYVYIRLPYDGAGNCQPLFLAPGEIDASLRDERGELFRHLFDELESLRDSSRVLYVIRGSFLAAEANVVSHCAGEQYGLLRDKSDPGPKIGCF